MNEFLCLIYTFSQFKILEVLSETKSQLQKIFLLSVEAKQVYLFKYFLHIYR